MTQCPSGSRSDYSKHGADLGSTVSGKEVAVFNFFALSAGKLNLTYSQISLARTPGGLADLFELSKVQPSRRSFTDRQTRSRSIL